MRSRCTWPNRAPVDSTHVASAGHLLAFFVQTPSGSALRYSTKPLSSTVPVAEVTGAKNGPDRSRRSCR